MAVEHGLAVFDAFGEPAHGHRIPAVGFGQFTCTVDDRLPALGTFAFLAFLNRHTEILATLDKLAITTYDRHIG